MTAAKGRVFFDTCTLENFRVIDQLGLLREMYQDRCAWVAGVAEDLKRIHSDYPNTLGYTEDWLGEVI